MTLSPKEGQGATSPIPVSSARTIILAARLAGCASAGPSAPGAWAPSPARHSLPWPEAGLRDQAARARTTGQARAAGRIRASRTHPV